MRPEGTLLLKRNEVASLLSIEEGIRAVEHAFQLHAEENAPAPGVLGVHAPDGGFHIKAGLMKLGKTYFAAKANANFPQNAKRRGLPLIQGLLLLYDGESGYPLAVMDSIEITIIRTGAATAVAALYLSREDSEVVTVCGCGNQGRVSLRAITRVRRITRAYAFDVDGAQAARFAEELSRELNIEVSSVDSLAEAVGSSDICVTCTPSKRYFLESDFVSPGTFVAAVGADNEQKQEIDPRLLAANKVVVDLLGQCASIGDLHHAIEKGLMTVDDVHAEIGEVICGKKSARESEDEIIIFDSTGIALQDVAAAAIVYEKALKQGVGRVVNFAEL